MENWIKERLSICLDFQIPDEMISFILSMKTGDEIDEYFETLLNYELPEHKLFINDFKQRFFNRTNPNLFQNKRVRNKPQQQQPQQQQPQKNGKATEKIEEKKPIQIPQKELPSSSSGQVAVKKKTKYTNLYTQDGKLNDTVLLKGRHHCDCQAGRHKLVNNCQRCGRIVCEQEGSGPCLFCGNLVCSEDEQKMINSSTKKGDNLKKSLMEQNRPKGWEEALAQRNRLLEYDRTSEKRTTVIDDESDYFKANSVWLSDVERKKLDRLEEEMREKKHASRLNRKVTIDFGGRQVIDEPQMSLDYEEEIFRQISKSNADDIHANIAKSMSSMHPELSDTVHPGIEGPAPVFIHSQSDQGNNKENFGDNQTFDGVYNRVQDKELLEISDMRHCISMHQPYASLLVEGIKKHEGRSWYTSHRGRLWIASTAKPVSMDEIKAVENFYRIHYKNDGIVFPSQYPTGVLLGHVTVRDCLPQDEYRKAYPDGESESPYVFICNDPQELLLNLPNKGSHKIYKLDPKMHTAAIKCMRRQAKLKAEESAT